MNTLCWAFWLCAATASAAPLRHGPPVIIEHVNVARGEGEPDVDDARVVLHNGQIVSVASFATPEPLAFTPQAERIDGRGKTLTAGLIEPWSRLGLSEIDAEADTNDASWQRPGSAAAAYGPAGAWATPAFSAADGLNTYTLWAAEAREQGVTSALAAPDGGLIYGTGAWVDLTTPLRLHPANPIAMFGGVGEKAAHATGGSRGGVWLLWRTVLDDARFYGASSQRVERNASRPLLLHPVHLRALQPLLAAALPLVVEAHRADDIRTLAHFAQTQGLRLVVAGGTEAYMVRTMLAQQNIPVIYNPLNAHPIGFETLHARPDAAALLHKAGVRLLLSAGPDNSGLLRLRQHAGMAVAYGLPHKAALSAVTGNAARTFGLQQSLGSINVGKRANVVLWSGDPFELDTVVEKVFIDGCVQSTQTRQRALAERYMAVSVAPCANLVPDRSWFFN